MKLVMFFIFLSLDTLLGAVVGFYDNTSLKDNNAQINLYIIDGDKKILVPKDKIKTSVNGSTVELLSGKLRFRKSPSVTVMSDDNNWIHFVRKEHKQTYVPPPPIWHGNDFIWDYINPNGSAYIAPPWVMHRSSYAGYIIRFIVNPVGGDPVDYSIETPCGSFNGTFSIGAMLSNRLCGAQFFHTDNGGVQLFLRDGAILQ